MKRHPREGFDGRSLVFLLTPTEQGLVGRFGGVFRLNANGEGLVGRLLELLRARLVFAVFAVARGRANKGIGVFF